MGYLEVTSNQNVSDMIKKPKTDPPACTNDILAIQDTLEVLGGRWKILIVHYLMLRENEVVTFKKMEKDIEGISAKMLSKELKTLEMNQLIHREVMNTKPIAVQYSITEYGKQTKEVIQAMVNWGEMHRMHLFQSED
jgi:DNA-binding HxlR family transcriptional regulator